MTSFHNTLMGLMGSFSTVYEGLLIEKKGQTFWIREKEFATLDLAKEYADRTNAAFRGIKVNQSKKQ